MIQKRLCVVYTANQIVIEYSTVQYIMKSRNLTFINSYNPILAPFL